MADARDRNNRRQFYAALEGIDGSGKTSALSAIQGRLEAAGLSVCALSYTAKSGILGALIRHLYSDSTTSNWVIRGARRSRAIQSLFFSTNGKKNFSRRDRSADVLLTDRSAVTGWVCHRGRLPKWFLSLTEVRLTPDMVVFLRIDPLLAQQRLVARGGADYDEDLESLRAFYRDYEQVFSSPPKRLRSVRTVEIDAGADKETVAEAATAAVRAAYELWLGQRDYE